jgi:hypothetical protein
MRDIETTISELSEVRRLAEARMNDDSGDHVAAE